MAKLTKEEIGFTQVKNEVLNDKELSFFDKGLFSFLFSKPDGWNFSANRISEESSDGRRSVLESLKRLETKGYLTRVKLPNGKVDYCLRYSQSAESALRVEDPKSRNSTVLKQHSAKTDTISNTLSISNKDSKITRKVEHGNIIDVETTIDGNVVNHYVGFDKLKTTGYPEWLHIDAWDSWWQYRKEIKKKMTDRTTNMQWQLLKKYNKMQQAEIIETSIRNGWTGLFDLKQFKNINSKPIYAAK